VSRQLTPGQERVLQRLLDLGERLFVLFLFGVLVANLQHGLTLRPYNILVIIHEGVTVALIVARRYTTTLTTRPLDWLAAFLGTGMPLLVHPGGHSPLPPLAGATLMVGGMLFSLWGLLALRRSFGIAAANRGVVLAGPYRLVRHPIYLGYLLVHLGFLLNNPLLWNAAVYACATAFQIFRILAEERVLGDDPAYAEVQRRVRWRLIPGLF
jgi:protein-S-isoprenylcysteine O-methyltransferase Ste14